MAYDEPTEPNGLSLQKISTLPDGIEIHYDGQKGLILANALEGDDNYDVTVWLFQVNNMRETYNFEVRDGIPQLKNKCIVDRGDGKKYSLAKEIVLEDVLSASVEQTPA